MRPGHRAVCDGCTVSTTSVVALWRMFVQVVRCLTHTSCLAAVVEGRYRLAVGVGDRGVQHSGQGGDDLLETVRRVWRVLFSRGARHNDGSRAGSGQPLPVDRHRNVGGSVCCCSGHGWRGLLPGPKVQGRCGVVFG